MQMRVQTPCLLARGSGKGPLLAPVCKTLGMTHGREQLMPHKCPPTSDAAHKMMARGWVEPLAGNNTGTRLWPDSQRLVRHSGSNLQLYSLVVATALPSLLRVLCHVAECLHKQSCHKRHCMTVAGQQPLTLHTTIMASSPYFCCCYTAIAAAFFADTSAWTWRWHFRADCKGQAGELHVP